MKQAPVAPDTEEARILAELTKLNLDSVRPRYPNSRRLKYLNVERFVRRDLRLCRMLGLDRSPPLRILDIGCGAGLFLYCLRRYGHDAVGIDIEDPFYAEMAALYRIDRRIEPVRPFSPLQIDGTFDVITCIATTFDRFLDGAAKRKGIWGGSEWLFFLSDLETRLRADGRIFIWLNKTGDEIRPHDAFSVGAQKISHRQLLFDRAGLTRTIAALERNRGAAATS